MSLHHRAEHRVSEHMTRVRRGTPSARKAQAILDDGMVRGHRLTARQRRFMGARATGQPRRHEE